MKRRQFIQSSLLAASTPIILTDCLYTPAHSTKQKITGLIFSDAHIGWKGKDQPPLEIQKNAIQTLKKYFGSPDLVFDTGDVHHGNLRENERNKARAFWLDEMAGQFPTSLFHYIPGNHELGRGLHDAELTAGQLGSFAFRPYYSFDYNGVHFVSLPQLQDTILISQESLNWLQIDLDINKYKTTLVFSHNSLEGTTYNNNATGYRVTVNSKQVTDILDKHNNIIAWFHGHNHQYEIVKKEQRLYVSNGRIGGFDPPKDWGDFGQGHLGGVYFEIDSSGLTVKCFSATQNDFFENFGMTHLSNRIDCTTSFNPRRAVNYYWGHGMMEGNNVFKFHNHYLTNRRSLAYISNNQVESINANHDFSYGTEFRIDRGPLSKLIGYLVEPKDVKYSKVPDGVLITSGEKQPFYVKLPIESYLYGSYLSRTGYYRCGLGSRYQLNVSCESEPAKEVLVKYKVLDINHKLCYQSKQWVGGHPTQDILQYDINIPEELTSEPADNKLYLFITVRFYSKSVLLKDISLCPNGSIGEQSVEQVSISGKLIDSKKSSKTLHLNEASGEVKLMDVVAPKTLYIKTPDVIWQVRNANATIDSDGLVIHGLRNHFVTPSQVIITPTSQREFYVNELINISNCQIQYTENSLSIDFSDVQPEMIVVIVANKPATGLKGLKLKQAVNKSNEYLVTGKQVYLTY